MVITARYSFCRGGGESAEMLPRSTRHFRWDQREFACPLVGLPDAAPGSAKNVPAYIVLGGDK
jgi:hypothetical protein